VAIATLRRAAAVRDPGQDIPAGVVPMPDGGFLVLGSLGLFGDVDADVNIAALALRPDGQLDNDSARAECADRAPSIRATRSPRAPGTSASKAPTNSAIVGA
jgi:hypothetical protein